VRCAAHNETLAVLEYLPAWRRPIYALWALGVGNVAIPGPAQLLRALVTGRGLDWRAGRAALLGRLEGWRTFRGAPPPAPPAPSVLAVGHSAYAAARARQLLGSGPVVVAAGGGWRGVARACGAVLRRRARVVYLVDVGMSTSVAALLGRALGRRVVLDTGDLGYELARSVGGRSRLGLAAVALGERTALRCAHHVIVRGRAHLAHLNGSPASVVPDVAPEEAEPAPGDAVRASLGLPADAFVVGLVGSLNWSPRLRRCYGWDLLEAIAGAPSHVHALIVGDGDGREWLEARARELGVAERCHFAGRVPPDRVAEWIGAMDAAVSTQTNDAVGSVRTTGKLPLYLACGCPVLASDVGEAARLLGPLGWTVPYAGTVDEGYPERLRAAIAGWAADPAGQADRRASARRLAREAFDADEMRRRLAGVLERVGAG
jgi:glycosyltransferase involved in cell wall biosynthesis